MDAERAFSRGRLHKPSMNHPPCFISKSGTHSAFLFSGLLHSDWCAEWEWAISFRGSTTERLVIERRVHARVKE